jgi:hypothetical protein
VFSLQNEKSAQTVQEKQYKYRKLDLICHLTSHNCIRLVVHMFEEELQLQLLQLAYFGFDLDFLLVMVWNFCLAFGYSLDSSSSHEPLEHHIADFEEVEDEAIEVPFAAIHEEDLDHESTQASPSFPHEDKGMVSYGSLQISEFDDLHIDDLEMNVFEERTLGCDDKFANLFIHVCDKNESSKEHLSFQNYGHGLGMDCWKLYGDPIYDIDGDVSSEKNDDLLTYEHRCM